MNYRRLGESGLKVSEISLGSWTTYGGSVAEADAAPIIRRAFEVGINCFDTADVYARGGAERAMGAALKGLPREQIVIATKVMGRVWDGPLGAGLSRKHIFDAMDQSLERLGVDYVDLYQAHAPDPDTPIEETLEAFEDLVRGGKARYIGLSNFEREPPQPVVPGGPRRVLAIQKERGWTPMVSSQARYSLLDRHIEKEHLDWCRRSGIGLLAYSPLAQGVLTNKYADGKIPEGSRLTGPFAFFLTQEKAITPENLAAAARFAAWGEKRGVSSLSSLALAWVVQRPGVSSAIIGATSVAQLEENLKYAEVQFGASDWAEVEAAIAGPTVKSEGRSAAKKTRRARAR